VGYVVGFSTNVPADAAQFAPICTATQKYSSLEVDAANIALKSGQNNNGFMKCEVCCSACRVLGWGLSKVALG